MEIQDKIDDRVLPGEGVLLPLPRAGAVFAEETAAAERMAPKVIALSPAELEEENNRLIALKQIYDVMRGHEIHWRVNWVTPLGSPRSQSGTARGPLGPDEDPRRFILVAGDADGADAGPPGWLTIVWDWAN